MSDSEFKKRFRDKSFLFLAEFLVGILILGGFFLIKFPPKPILEKQAQDLEKILPPPADYPKNNTGQPPPPLTAKSVVVMDVDSEAILWEKNSQLVTLPASTTKIMSALVALENYQLDQVIVVGNIGKVEGQKMKLFPGEKITVENLLYGLLVGSANDAALVLAQNFPQGEIGFVWAMNQKAKELELRETNFTNPVGFDSSQHFTTASDLTHLSVYAMQDPRVTKFVGTEKITVTDVEGKTFHQLTNINSLVGKIPGVKGVKTGWTQLAGECLVSYVERNGRRIVTVILGSQDRFKETSQLIEWVFSNFVWERFSL